MPGRHVTDKQMRIFVGPCRTHSVEVALAKAGFSVSTGYRIKRDPRFPSRNKAPRGRLRPDPLAVVRESEVVPMLEMSKDVRSVDAYQELTGHRPKLNPGIRRTLERRVRMWRALNGPER